MKCAHCKQPIEAIADHWAHPWGPKSYRNRCQSADVPYGMEAHPEDVPCPNWCLGARA